MCLPWSHKHSLRGMNQRKITADGRTKREFTLLLLVCDKCGHPKTHEIDGYWVWSDFENNTKKQLARKL